MYLMKRILFWSALVSLVVNVACAFTLPSPGSLTSHAPYRPHLERSVEWSSSFSTELFLAKKKETPDSTATESLDWGKILGLFVNPLNPYAWFVYFFAFIIGYGALAGN